MLGGNATCYLRFPFVVDNPDVLALAAENALRRRLWRLNGEVAPQRAGAGVELAAGGTLLDGRCVRRDQPGLRGKHHGGHEYSAIQALNVGKDDPDFLINLC